MPTCASAGGGASPAAKGYADLETALRGPWDAAVIATPAHTHIAIAKRLASMVCIFSLKSRSASRWKAWTNCAKYAKSECTLLAWHTSHRSNIVFAQMHEAIVSGRFGKPLQVIAVCGQHFPTFRPAYREIYYTDRSKKVAVPFRMPSRTSSTPPSGLSGRSIA